MQEFKSEKISKSTFVTNLVLLLLKKSFVEKSQSTYVHVCCLCNVSIDIINHDSGLYYITGNLACNLIWKFDG